MAEADAAVTSVPGTVLAILTADCLPVLLCDSDGSEVAAAHAGWRGLADGVLEVTLLGQNVNSYGRDLSGSSHFAELLRDVGAVAGIELDPPFRDRPFTVNPGLSWVIVERGGTPFARIDFPGAVFGEMSWVLDKPATATALGAAALGIFASTL